MKRISNSTVTYYSTLTADPHEICGAKKWEDSA